MAGGAAGLGMVQVDGKRSSGFRLDSSDLGARVSGFDDCMRPFHQHGGAKFAKTRPL